ncbi:MAG: MBL fold metallo-hydrolase [Anaerolineae bacterium]|nr:MBL fold metallo-hydrolase [Anaerolineae bacterium]
MDITWYGHSCFRLTERGSTSIVTDPFDPGVGYGALNLKAQVVTISHEAAGHAHVDAVRDWEYVINRPGEYEIGGVFIIGTPMFNKKADDPKPNIVYSFDYSGVIVVHLGDLDHVPSQSALESLGEVAVLLVPVGGGGALNASQAAEVVSLIEPAIVVPMHYKTPHTQLELAGVEKFLAEMGVTSPTEEETLKVSTSGLPAQTQVTLLSYKQG